MKMFYNLGARCLFFQSAFMNEKVSCIHFYMLYNIASRDRYYQLSKFSFIECSNVVNLPLAFSIRIIYTMHNKFSNFLCFASLCA